MNSRLDVQKLSPNLYNTLFALEKQLGQASLEKSLADLVKIRVSQLNGCLFCLDMHSKEARKHGERELRLYHLPLWRESELFSEKERAGLEYAERLTRLDGHGVEDADFQRLAAHFTEQEMSELTVQIGAINLWNRLGVARRSPAGELDKLMGLDKVALN
ncbi:MAG: carboxymuconolactone decarboxylase family protein [Candidatus Eremiobacteraeota bacterium]|nr:carboxymuconolactone decarboxylase family protein [Candidatus Eremiobacteraeota bacterium]